EEAVRGPEASRAESEGHGGLQGRDLLGGVSLQVDLGGRLVRVPEPEGYFADIPGGLEDAERARVPQRMGRDPLVAKRRTLRAGGGGVLADDVGKPGPRHVSAAGIEKELRDGCRAANGEPGAEGVADLLPQQKRALLAPLAAHADLDIPPVEAHLVEAQADEFGDPQPAGETQVEHGAVTNSKARRGVRRVQDGPRVRG